MLRTGLLLAVYSYEPVILLIGRSSLAVMAVSGGRVGLDASTVWVEEVDVDVEVVWLVGVVEVFDEEVASSLMGVPYPMPASGIFCWFSQLNANETNKRAARMCVIVFMNIPR